MESVEDIIKEYRTRYKTLKAEFKKKLFDKLVEVGIKKPTDSFSNEEFLNEVLENQGGD